MPQWLYSRLSITVHLVFVGLYAFMRSLLLYAYLYLFLVFITSLSRHGSVNVFPANVHSYL